MIKVLGSYKLRGEYICEIPMTLEEWENLTERKQNELIYFYVDWHETLKSGELDDVDVDEIIEE